MIQCRKNCFETNSSSTHSLVIPLNIQEDDIQFNNERLKANAESFIEWGDYTLDKNGDVLVTPGSYDWGIDFLYSAQDKLNYIITLMMVNVVNHEILYADEYDYDFEEIKEQLYNSDEFQDFNDIFKSYTGRNVVLKNHFNEVHIDHQSVVDVDMFLSKNNVSFQEYLFNDKIYLLIGNDNTL